MGRPRKSVRPASFSIDAKMYKLLQELAEKDKRTMSHFVNMALYEYKPIRELDTYRGWWKCDQRDCAVLNPPAEEKCKAKHTKTRVMGPFGWMNSYSCKRCK